MVPCVDLTLTVTELPTTSLREGSVISGGASCTSTVMLSALTPQATRLMQSYASIDVLRIPLSALFRQGEGWAVFVAQEGRAALRPVGVGRQNGLEAEITSGLAPGERIVLHPSDRVTDRARIAQRA